MKARVDLISKELFLNFGLSYKQSIKIFIKCLDEIKKIDSFWIWPLTNYIALYGLDDLKTSALGMKEMTKRFSSEFVIRYFIQAYTDTFFEDYLFLWINDEDEHVRRLVSEGTRPNLPWGIKVDYLNNNLKQNILLLNKIRNDESLYVRKSVANHLNDISHIDPDLMLKTLSSWKNRTAKEIWIIKRASRTLLKNGHPKALRLNGFNIDPKIKLSHKTISKQKIKEGDSFEISFDIKNLSSHDLKLSVDYIIYYPKKSGELSPKVFKLKDITLKDKICLTKKVSFKKVTTRKHYPGEHKIEIKVSNKTFAFKKFMLME